jgi:hypothetical protein
MVLFIGLIIASIPVTLIMVLIARRSNQPSYVKEFLAIELWLYGIYSMGDAAWRCFLSK